MDGFGIMCLVRNHYGSGTDGAKKILNPWMS